MPGNIREARAQRDVKRVLRRLNVVGWTVGSRSLDIGAERYVPIVTVIVLQLTPEIREEMTSAARAGGFCVNISEGGYEG